MEQELMLKFIDAVIKKSGLTLDDNFLTDYREFVLSELERNLWLMMVKELSGEALKQFMELADGLGDNIGNFADVNDKKKAELVEFFRKNITNFEEKILKRMDEFGDNFVEDVKRLKN